jgi:hypothetical protein
VSFTPNKNLQMPASGSFNNAWAAPVNLNWSEIDTALGGNSQIDVTGVASGEYTLTLAQYLPPDIAFVGTLGGNLVYAVPTGVGGTWTINNATTGAFTITFSVVGGVGPVIAQGFRSLVVSNGVNAGLADTSGPSQAQSNAEAFATAADVVVTTNANTFATNAANTAQANAETFSAIASNLSSGTVPNAQLPNVGIGPGVIIQADPGGTPSGPPGTLWLYY